MYLEPETPIYVEDIEAWEREAGVTVSNIFDNMDLEALAETAAQENRWEFMLTAGPIPVEGGTGSPLNPIAVF